MKWPITTITRLNQGANMPTKTSLEKRIRRINEQKKETVSTVVEKITMAGGALALGAYDGYVGPDGKPLPQQIMKVPVKILISGLAYLGAAMTKGKVSKLFEGLGDSATAVYNYKMARHAVSKSEGNLFVQGEE